MFSEKGIAKAYMVAIVSHDAGGAQIISSWLKHQSEPYCIVVEGPAIGIFTEKIGSFEKISLAEALQKSDWLLCGTSWQSELELEAIRAARLVKMKSVSVLDHWVCYQERFVRSEGVTLPDEIWVSDPYAKNIAKSLFKDIEIHEIRNFYLDDLKNHINSQSLNIPSPVTNGTCRVLYICEPLGEQALLQYGNDRYWGYNEFDAIEYFIENKNLVCSTIESITMRPHPAEKRNKYDSLVKKYPGLITIGGNDTLIEEMKMHDVLVGCESMAMVIGIIGKKRVVSCIPPGGKVCELPHTEIEHLKDIVLKNTNG